MPVKNSLQAYHGDPAVKAKHVVRMRAHQEAGELVHGVYWNNGRGCGIGCTIHSDDHAAYETELGWPEWLARLEDRIFEGMTKEAAQQFPLRLLTAVPVGFSDWDGLYHEFCAYILCDICEFDDVAYPNVRAAVDGVIRLHETRSQDDVVWSAASSAAWLAARLAARSAAWSKGTAARLAADAAEAAAWSTRSAAWSRGEAARLAARSAAWSRGEAAVFDSMADWLVKRLAPA